ncbi:MAG: heme ABC exporter ATP-binding protein CcmA [Desulfohalobiaceae bacterium]|nr:heme ABC exporter ATP-binding protein CcmA [Desulfohalobiaceae bacterium]MCF8085378.1 heme ABC exporter ATP-binding protein CcmA [Desulfohalobiaceae bacterium]
MLIEAEGLGKFFGVKPVFRKLDFRVDQGQVVLVLGENGSGKSTLLRILAGLLQPSAGRLHVGVEPGEIGYVGHQPYIYPGLSAWRNLRFWSRLYGISTDGRRMEEALARFGLERVKHEPVAFYSRGMLQRLSLARILCLAPRIYLLDEPSTGLDTPSRGVLQEVIHELRGNGCIVLWVSHYPERDMPLADRMLHLKDRSGWMEVPDQGSPESATSGPGLC